MPKILPKVYIKPLWSHIPWFRLLLIIILAIRLRIWYITYDYRVQRWYAYRRYRWKQRTKDIPCVMDEGLRIRDQGVMGLSES